MAVNWPTVPLARVAHVTSGKRPPLIMKNPSPDVSVPVIGGGGPSGFTSRVLFDGDVLITGRVGTLGKLFSTHGGSWPSDNALVIRPRSAATDSAFLRYALQAVISQAAAMNRGAANPLITQGDLGRLEIYHPPLTEQRAIAHILGTLDHKIELNGRINETLEDTARALFESWFVNFDPVGANVERCEPGLPIPIGDLFPDRLEDSELGYIPAGWRVGCLDDEFDLTMGQSPPGDTYNEAGEGLPFYQGRKDFGFRFPTRRVYCTGATRLAKAGDTLISVRAPVGDVNMASENCAIGRGVAAARHKTGGRSYCYQFMRSLHQVFERFEAQGTVFGSIGKKDFHAIPCVVPPRGLVIAFEGHVQPFDSQIEVNEHESRALAALRDTLLPKLISGELRVPQAERMPEAAPA
jgi:type I restriction enzyme S subunit